MAHRLSAGGGDNQTCTVPGQGKSKCAPGGNTFGGSSQRKSVDEQRGCPSPADAHVSQPQEKSGSSRGVAWSTGAPPWIPNPYGHVETASPYSLKSVAPTLVTRMIVANGGRDAGASPPGGASVAFAASMAAPVSRPASSGRSSETRPHAAPQSTSANAARKNLAFT